MKTFYLLQGGGKDEFPFFEEQPGNGQGNPPPFGEPTANINQWTTAVLLLIFFSCLFIIVRSFWKIKQESKRQTDWYKKWLNENYPDKTSKQ